MVSFKQKSAAAKAGLGANAISASQQSKRLQKASRSIPLAAAHFDELPESGYVRAPVVLALFGISQATLCRWVKSSRIADAK